MFSPIVLTGPNTYRLQVSSTGYSVICDEGRPGFKGSERLGQPKLYVVSDNDWPIYVGITKQPLAGRFRIGFTSTGQRGYHGYAWRNHPSQVTVDVWTHENAVERSEIDVKAIEAEIVFEIRAAGQWPRFQTEIHFAQSTALHRELAKSILSRYQSKLINHPDIRAVS